MGINMWGRFESSRNNDAELQELREKLALSDRKKKPRNGINLIKVGEMMLPRVKEKDLPWM